MQWHSLLLLYTTMDEKARETRMKSHGKNETGGHRPNKKGGARVLSYTTQMRLFFHYTTIYLSYHSHPIRPCGAPSPRGEGCDTRIASSKKAAHRPCESIRSPSTVIPSEAEGSLLHCRHMHTCTLAQTTPWCFLFRLSLTHVLPVCKKDPSTSVGMTFKENG